MFNIFGGVKTIIKQGEKIKRQEDLIKEQNSVWAEQHIKIIQLEKELAEIIESKDIAERRNIEYARIIKKISDEINTNQCGSVENLQNKIKSMLTVGKHF